jgi:2-keto-4-pentenoate hydratase/2-oxohepta-3-ene-1,7-dioic acid hydratase in catechol pathway
MKREDFMKIVLYDDYKVGLLNDGNVVDVSGVVPRGGTPQLTIEGLIDNFQSLKGALERELDRGKRVPLSSVRLRAPVPRPGKIVCMGGNFGEFVGRKGPLWGFLKSPEAVLDPGGTVVLSTEDANIFHHEAELVAVIGRAASGVSKDGALSNIFGYTCGCDVSGRFAPETRQQFGKSFDTFAPIGPCIVTADEIPDPHRVHVRMWVDGQVRHDYPMSDIAHSVEESLAWMSTMVTLKPGDLFFLGTNHQGIGPLQDGERAVIEIDGVGRLEFSVSDPLKRRWPKGVDEVSAKDLREGAGGPGRRARPLA